MTDLVAAPSATARVEDLLDRMTTAEKLAQLGGVWVPDLLVDGELDEARMEALLGNGIGHVSRIALETGFAPERVAQVGNAIQRFLLERTRLGIPAVLHEEAVAGVCADGATQYPQGIALASTWDPALVEEVARSIRRHLLAIGARVALSPVVDLARDPRWGRLEETYGEDPELASRLAVAYVRGLQGDDLRTGVGATAKHFVGHGLPDAGFNQGEVRAGPRLVRDVLCAPFRAAVNEAGLACVMSAYHDLDGLACSGSAELLTSLLRGDVGFDGVVLADYWAVPQLETVNHVAAGPAEAARLALEAGVDVELPALDRYRRLAGLVESGEVDEAVVDRSVRRVLLQKAALGLFERALVDVGSAAAAFDRPEDRELARRAAARSIVLLANDGTLPLDPSHLRRVVVAGPAAGDPRLLLGDYSYPAHVEGMAGRAESRSVPMATPLDALRAALPGVDVVAPPAGEGEATWAATTADAAVVFVGGRSGVTRAATSGELRDAAHLEIPGGQCRLVHAVAATGTPTVVVVVSGRAHALVDAARAASALVLAWPPGEEGGAAIADVLTGRVAPAGRLPVSLLRTAGQAGVGSGHHTGGGRSRLYGDYVDEAASPLFCLGHGLSYTTFGYRDLAVRAGATADPVRLAVTVVNTGERDGDEVVQVYAHDAVASVVQPDQRLVAFARVPLRAGASRRVAFEVPAGRLGFTGADGRFVVEPGEVSFLVGASYDDVRVSSTAILTGPAAFPARNAVPPFSVTVSPEEPR